MTVFFSPHTLRFILSSCCFISFIIINRDIDEKPSKKRSALRRHHCRCSVGSLLLRYWRGRLVGYSWPHYRAGSMASSVLLAGSRLDNVALGVVREGVGRCGGGGRGWWTEQKGPRERERPSFSLFPLSDLS